MNVVIAYHSGSGHTRKLAECIGQGADLCPQCQTILMDTGEPGPVDWEILHAADAIILGSPTYMGSASGPFKTFLDATGAFWLERKWVNKIAAGFTVGSGPSGDKLSTLTQMAIFASQHSMIWVGQDLMSSLYTGDGKEFNRDVSFLGLMATASRNKTELISQPDQESARIFGLRIANAAARWMGAQKSLKLGQGQCSCPEQASS